MNKTIDNEIRLEGCYNFMRRPVANNVCRVTCGEVIDGHLVDELRDAIIPVMKTLHGIESEVIELCVFEDKSVATASGMIGVSVDVAREALKRGIRKMRHPSRIDQILINLDRYDTVLP